MSQTPENVIPMTTTVGVVRATGEVVDVEIPASRMRGRTGSRKVYALMELNALKKLELSALEWSVLHVIMAAVHPDSNEARVGVSEIALELDILGPSVSRVMRILRKRRIIGTLRQGVHRVNPHIMYRGSNKDWDRATETEREPLWRK